MRTLLAAFLLLASPVLAGTRIVVDFADGTTKAQFDDAAARAQ